MNLKIKSSVVKGNGLGKKGLFPTINLEYSGKDTGVFVGKVFIDGKFYKAAVNLGGRPTVDDKYFCEIHVLDWEGRIVEGVEMEVNLLKKIREVKKFGNLEELKMQIAQDVEFVRGYDI